MAIIDQHGDLVHHYAYTMPADSPSAAVRFKALLVTDGGDDEYGVMRTAVLRKVRGIDSYYCQPRHPFLAEMSLHGPFRQVLSAAVLPS